MLRHSVGMGKDSKKRRDAKKKLAKRPNEELSTQSLDNCCTPTGCTATDGTPLFDLAAFRAGS